MFKELYEEGKLYDVTLVCDDQTQFKAHKIVLSACSPLFKKFIDNNPSQHPLIYLRGIQSYEMESILQFIYLGEGIACQERVEEFVKVAKDLEVKKICEDGENKEEDHTLKRKRKGELIKVSKDLTRKVISKYSVAMEENDETVMEDHDTETGEYEVQDQPIDNTSPKVDQSDTECPECPEVFTTQSTMMTHYRSVHEGNHDDTTIFDGKCLEYQLEDVTEDTVSDFFYFEEKEIDEDNGTNQISEHKIGKRKSSDNQSFVCDECHAVFKAKKNLLSHYGSKHENIKYPCNYCGYQATQRSSLKLHIQSQHEGIKYHCNQCDYQATLRANLRRHIETKHEDIRFPCRHCDYQANDRESLQKHIQFKH